MNIMFFLHYLQGLILLRIATGKFIAQLADEVRQPVEPREVADLCAHGRLHRVLAHRVYLLQPLVPVDRAVAVDVHLAEHAVHLARLDFAVARHEHHVVLVELAQVELVVLVEQPL